MDIIYNELLIDILTSLPKDSIMALKVNPRFASIIDSVVRNNIFWKGQVETLFGRHTNYIFSNWKQVYNYLTKKFPSFDVVRDGNKALVSAAISGNMEIVDLLIADSRVDPSANNNEAFIKASLFGRLEIVKILLKDPRVDPSANNNKALMDTLNPEIVKLLLNDPRVDPSANNNKAIIDALNPKIVKLLLNDPRVDPSATNNKAIKDAMWFGRLEKALLLKDPRVDPSVNYGWDIITVLKEGNLEMMKLLLNHPRGETKV